MTSSHDEILTVSECERDVEEYIKKYSLHQTFLNDVATEAEVLSANAYACLKVTGRQAISEDECENTEELCLIGQEYIWRYCSRFAVAFPHLVKTLIRGDLLLKSDVISSKIWNGDILIIIGAQCLNFGAVPKKISFTMPQRARCSLVIDNGNVPYAKLVVFGNRCRTIKAALSEDDYDSEYKDLKDVKECKYARLVGLVSRCEKFKPRSGSHLTLLSLVDQSLADSNESFQVLIKNSSHLRIEPLKAVILSRVTVARSERFRNLNGYGCVGCMGFSIDIFSPGDPNFRAKFSLLNESVKRKLASLIRWARDLSPDLKLKYHICDDSFTTGNVPKLTTLSAFPHTAYRDVAVQAIGLFHCQKYDCAVMRAWDGTKTSRLYEKIDISSSKCHVIDLNAFWQKLPIDEYAVDIFVFDRSIGESLRGVKSGDLVIVSNLHSYSRPGSRKVKFVLHDNTRGYERGVAVLDQSDRRFETLQNRLDPLRRALMAETAGEPPIIRLE